MMESKGHDGETLVEAVDRAADDLEDPLDRHHNSRGRVGLLDLPHALVNLPVEWCRADPYTAGHFLFWLVVYAAVVTVVLIGVLAWL